jgi:hypothetical protein
MHLRWILVREPERKRPLGRTRRKISKAFPVTGRGGLYGCEVLRTPHCLENQLTDGGEVVSATHLPRSAPQKHHLRASGTHFG